MSPRYAALLDGIEQADSVAVSAHKWLFQPKESAFVLFRDAPAAHAALSFGGPYLAAPNVGLLGSHGAMAVPLLALLWAWGSDGIAARLDRCMATAENVAGFVAGAPRLELLQPPQTGVVIWRPRHEDAASFAARLPPQLASTTLLQGERWLRCVAANPLADGAAINAAIRHALDAA